MRHKRAIPNRSLRVSDQIQRDLAELIRDLKDPRIGMTHNLGGAPRENISSVAIVGRYE